MNRGRLTRALAAAVFVVLVVWLVMLLFPSEERRIRNLIDGMRDDFNDGDADVTDGFSDPFRFQKSQSFDRGEIRSYFAGHFIRQQFSQGGRLSYRVEIVDDDYPVEVDDDTPMTAHLSLSLRFLELAGDDWKPFSDVTVEGDLSKDDKGDWHITDVLTKGKLPH